MATLMAQIWCGYGADMAQTIHERSAEVADLQETSARAPSWCARHAVFSRDLSPATNLHE